MDGLRSVLGVGEERCSDWEEVCFDPDALCSKWGGVCSEWNVRNFRSEIIGVFVYLVDRGFRFAADHVRFFWSIRLTCLLISYGYGFDTDMIRI